jgi:hypothetical protein
MTWTNADGLVVRDGADDVAAPKGTVERAGLQRLVVKLTDATLLEVNSTDPLTSASTVAFFDENTPSIPAGSYIARAYLKVDTAFTSGGSATLDVGLMQADGTIVDVNGIDATVAVAALGANAVVNCNGAAVGGVVLTSATLDTYVCFAYATAAFTAGAATVIVEYYEF